MDDYRKEIAKLSSLGLHELNELDKRYLVSLQEELKNSLAEIDGLLCRLTQSANEILFKI